MKKLLLGSTMLLGMVAGAAAADLPVYSKAPPPAWSWTGFYLGVQGGAGWGTSEDSTTALQGAGGGPILATPPGVFRSSFTLNGLHGGGTAGFNWQSGPIVFGVEGDISGSNIDGKDDCGGLVGKPAAKIVRRTDTDVAVAEFKKVNVPHVAAVSLRSRRSFGRHPSP